MCGDATEPYWSWSWDLEVPNTPHWEVADHLLDLDTGSWGDGSTCSCFLEFLQWCRHVSPRQLFHIPWPHGQEIELAVEARTVSFGKKELLSEPEWLSVMSYMWDFYFLPPNHFAVFIPRFSRFQFIKFIPLFVRKF